MNFEHQTVSLPELTTQTINKKRFYVCEDGTLYPSITTVLSKWKKEGLVKWRQKVGDDVANYIMRTAAARGNAVHHMCEDFLNNIEINKEDRDFLPYMLFSQLKPVLEKNITNIYSQECGLYSDKYRVAGRVDCIADWDGVPSIIDFKTSRSERNDNYNESYYMQASAYAEMFEERTGIAINQIVILVVTEDGNVTPFVKQKSDYLPLLVQAIDNFTSEWEKENEVDEDPAVIGAPV